MAPLPFLPVAGATTRPDTRPWRDDLMPIAITQPEGPSFTIEGNLLRWQRWSMRVSLEPHEGLVLPHCGPTRTRGRIRSHSCTGASITEMIVPYGHPGPMHGWKNAFDASEWWPPGGSMANSLAADCDCLGDLISTRPWSVSGAMSMSSERRLHPRRRRRDRLEARPDLAAGTSEVRRGPPSGGELDHHRGNYDYGVFWYFYLDGHIEMEVKLTGIVTTIAWNPGMSPGHATRITGELAAPHHQHLFCARLDLDVEGPSNSV